MARQDRPPPLAVPEHRSDSAPQHLSDPPVWIGPPFRPAAFSRAASPRENPGAQGYSEHAQQATLIHVALDILLAAVGIGRAVQVQPNM